MTKQNCFISVVIDFSKETVEDSLEVFCVNLVTNEKSIQVYSGADSIEDSPEETILREFELAVNKASSLARELEIPIQISDDIFITADDACENISEKMMVLL